MSRETPEKVGTPRPRVTSGVEGTEGRGPEPERRVTTDVPRPESSRRWGVPDRKRPQLYTRHSTGSRTRDRVPVPPGLLYTPGKGGVCGRGRSVGPTSRECPGSRPVATTHPGPDEHPDLDPNLHSPMADPPRNRNHGSGTSPEGRNDTGAIREGTTTLSSDERRGRWGVPGAEGSRSP